MPRQLVDRKTFREDLQAWLETQPKSFSSHFPISTSPNKLYRIGKMGKPEETYFDENEILSSFFNGNESHREDSRILARHLNTLYGVPPAKSDPPLGSSFIDAEEKPPSSQPAPSDPAPAASTLPRSQPSPSQASPLSAPPPTAKAPTPQWRFPPNNFTRADEDTEVWGEVKVSPGEDDEGKEILQYEWNEEEGENVYRVVTSESEEPYEPDGFDEVAAVEDLYFEDDAKPTSPYRFVTVWAYPKDTHRPGRLKQSRLVAKTLYVHPIRDWKMSFQDGAVIGEWERVKDGHRRTVHVDVARLPEDESPRPFLRHQRWLEHRFDDDGSRYLRGFQDDNVEEGHSYTYVAAVCVEFNNQKLYSRPKIQKVEVKPAAPSPVRDLQAVLMEGEANRWRIEWTAPSTGEVLIYRTKNAPDAGAVARPEMPFESLATAGLTEGDKLKSPSIPLRDSDNQPTGRWCMNKVAWPTGDEWDEAYLTPVTQIDDSFSIGTPVPQRRSLPATDVTVVQRMTWQMVTFEWPGKAASVNLYRTRRGEEFSSDLTVEATIEEEQYRLSGGFALKDPLPPEGARIHLISVSHYDGEAIISEPVSLDVPPLWGYEYSLAWPQEKWLQEQHEKAKRVASQLSGRRSPTPVALTVISRWGTCPPSHTPRLVLVYNPDRLPLSAQDGKRIPMYSQPPGKEVMEEKWSIEAPGKGKRTVVYFDAHWGDIEYGKGYFRLVVDAPHEKSQGANIDTSLQRYALADPPIADLKNR